MLTICFKDSLGFVSVINSGIIFDKAMYKNPPLVNGSIQHVTSPAFSAELYANANKAPVMPEKAVTSLNKNMFLITYQIH